MSGYIGFQEPDDTASDFRAQSFLIEQIINRIATTTLVKVMKVTNVGGITPVGLIDVSPLVHQIDGGGNPTPHGTIHNVPYFRIQGGTDAMILDPKVGDIGIAVFCSRDISAVKRNKAPGTPTSRRKFDWADALYIGGVLNGIPTQYVAFSATGIAVTSPTKVTITAPTTEIDGNVIINGNLTSTSTTGGAITLNATTLTVNANVVSTGTVTNNGHDISSTHRHTASGGTGTGGPPV